MLFWAIEQEEHISVLHGAKLNRAERLPEEGRMNAISKATRP